MVVPRPRLCLRSLPRDLQPDRRRARVLPTTKHLRVLRERQHSGRAAQTRTGWRSTPPAGRLYEPEPRFEHSRRIPCGMAWRLSGTPNAMSSTVAPRATGAAASPAESVQAQVRVAGPRGPHRRSRRSGARTHFPPKLSAALCRFGRSNTRSADGRQSLASTTRESRTSLVRRETVTTRRRQLQGEVQHIDDELEIIDRELRHRSYAA